MVDLNLAPGDESQPPTATVRKTLSLPFAPRQQLLVKNDTRLIVADAFGGNLGVVDTASGELLFVRRLPAHNIRGLALLPGGEKLVVAHQILNDLAETTHNDVHWGVLMSNVLRWVKLDQLLAPHAELLKDSHVHLAGDTNVAGGDPAAVAVTRDGQAVLALAGVNEVAFGHEREFYLRRLPVGTRPRRWLPQQTAAGPTSPTRLTTPFPSSI